MQPKEHFSAESMTRRAIEKARLTARTEPSLPKWLSEPALLSVASVFSAGLGLYFGQSAWVLSTMNASLWAALIYSVAFLAVALATVIRIRRLVVGDLQKNALTLVLMTLGLGVGYGLSIQRPADPSSIRQEAIDAVVNRFNVTKAERIEIRNRLEAMSDKQLCAAAIIPFEQCNVVLGKDTSRNSGSE